MRFFLITILLSISSVCGAHQWPALRGDASATSSIRYTGDEVLPEWHYSYKGNRRYETGMIVWASPALAVVAGKPMAFIGGYDQTMHALDLTAKEARWRKLTNGEIKSAPVVGTLDGLDVVVWGSSDRTVYAVAAYNGRQLWTRELIEASNTLGEAHLSSPFIHGDVVYITAFVYDKSLPRNKQKGVLYCLSLRTGTVIWTEQVSSGFLSSPVGFENGGRLYIAVCARRGLLSCYDVSESAPKLAWTFQMPHEVLGSPAVASDTSEPLLFLGSKFGNIIAINALTGKEVWQRMAGNWIDNTACVGKIDGQPVVFVGSHDYHVYAYDALSGELIWTRALGGEVFSVPSFFEVNGQPFIVVACLDNHLYCMDGRTGTIINAYYTGQPVWDKIAKGESVWGSASVFASGQNSVAVYGAFNAKVYSLPLFGSCSLQAMARSVKSLWVTLLMVFLIFTFLVLPLVLLPLRKSV
ncbi:MAG: PQQ-binding-like beta-propeller repeat protein [Candidatus Auribacterota bacterium]